jgi:hypothetical protein
MAAKEGGGDRKGVGSLSRTFCSERPAAGPIDRSTDAFTSMETSSKRSSRSTAVLRSSRLNGTTTMQGFKGGTHSRP